jgi:hypothetical protein
LIWIAEGAEVRDRLYPDTSAIPPAYALTNKPILEEQLEKGGVRLAAYLNQLFAETQTTTASTKPSRAGDKR